MCKNLCTLRTQGKDQYSQSSASLLFYIQTEKVDLIKNLFEIVHWAMLLGDFNGFILQQQNKVSPVNDDRK